MGRDAAIVRNVPGRMAVSSIVSYAANRHSVIKKPLELLFTVDFAPKLWYNYRRWFFFHGEMAERLMALVLENQ